MDVQSYDAPEWQTWAGSGLYSMLPYRRNSQKQSAMPVEVRFNYDWGLTSSNGWWGDPNQSEQTRTHLDSALIQLVEIKALQKGSAASLEMFIAPLIQLVWPETCTFQQPELSSVSRQAPVIETPAGCPSRVWLAQRCTFLRFVIPPCNECPSRSYVFMCKLTSQDNLLWVSDAGSS